MDGREKFLIIIAMGWFLSIGTRLTYPVLLPYLQDEYGLSLSAAGLLLTILWLAYALGQLPGGLVGDRIGEGTVMSLSMVIAGGTLVLIVIGWSAAMLFFSTALFGFALALFGTARLSALSDIYPEKRGTAIGILSAAGDIGNTVLPPFAGFIAASIAWQAGFGFVIPIFLLIGFLIWIIVPSRTSENRKSRKSISIRGIKSGLLGLYTQSILFILAIQIIANVIYQAFTGFYPTYLIEMKGLSPSIAASLFSLFFLLGAIIKPVSGNVFDRIGARQTLLVLVGVPGLGLTILPYIDGFWSLVAVTVIVSAMTGRGTIVMSYMTVEIPDKILNTGLGTLRTVYMIIGAASPAVFGMVADIGYFNEGYLLLAILSGLCVIVIWFLPEIESNRHI